MSRISLVAVVSLLAAIGLRPDHAQGQPSQANGLAGSWVLNLLDSKESRVIRFVVGRDKKVAGAYINREGMSTPLDAIQAGDGTLRFHVARVGKFDLHGTGSVLRGTMTSETNGSTFRVALSRGSTR